MVTENGHACVEGSAAINPTYSNADEGDVGSIGFV